MLYVARIPAFTELWQDLMTKPEKLAPNFTGEEIHTHTHTHIHTHTCTTHIILSYETLLRIVTNIVETYLTKVHCRQSGH